MTNRVIALLLASLCAACVEPNVDFSEDPMVLGTAGDGGGLLAGGVAQLGSTTTSQFPLLVDTASPITVFTDGSGDTVAGRGDLQVFAQTPAVRRLAFTDIQLMRSPLGGIGIDLPQALGGVLGGDNLRRFVLGLRYTPSPVVTLTDQLILEECELSERCGAVLPIRIAGGHQLIQLNDDLYTYPASYVLLDACLEPAPDPLADDIACSSAEACGDLSSCANVPDRPRCEQQINDCRADSIRYVQEGVDIRFAVATGFPGVAITASAYDRLRGLGSAATLIGAGTTALYLPDQTSGGTGLRVGRDSLGVAATQAHDGAARSALALVDKGVYFGACAEMARSRRLRRTDDHPGSPADANCLRSPELNPSDALLQVCESNATPSRLCDDRTDDAHTNAYVEILGSVPVLVLPDTTPLLQSINADVRPQSATVEGIMGTELLRRLGTTIDYASSRVVITCNDGSCRAFPTSRHGTGCKVPTVDHMFGGAPAKLLPGGGCAVP